MKYCKDCKYYSKRFFQEEDSECLKTETKEQLENSITGIFKYKTYTKCWQYRGSGECGREAKFFIHKNIFIRFYQWIKSKQVIQQLKHKRTTEE